MSFITNRTVQSVLAALIVSFVMISLYLPLLNVRGFAPKDDIQPLTIAAESLPHPQYDIYYEFDEGLIEIIQSDLRDHGRFRPLLWTFMYVEMALIPNAAIWQLETLIIGMLTVFMVYKVARQLDLGFIPALWASIWTIFVGSDLWTEKLFGEEQGILMVLLACSMLIYSARQKESPSIWDWIALFLLLCAGLTKESFVLIVPAMVGFRLVLRWTYIRDAATSGIDAMRDVFMRMLPFIIVSAVLTILLAIPILIAYSIGGYGQDVVGEFYSGRLFNQQLLDSMFQSVGQQSLYFLPVLTVGVGLAYLRERRNWMLAGFIVVLTIAFVYPQYVLHADTRFMTNYIIPAVLAIIFLSAFGLEWLRRLVPVPIFLSVAGILFLSVMIESYPASWYKIRSWKADINAFQKTIEIADANSDTNTPSILVFTGFFFEREDMLMLELGQRGFSGPIYYETPPNVRHRMSSERFLSLQDADPDTVGVIISYFSLDTFEKYAEENFDWFDADEWRVEEASDTFQLLSWRSILGISDIDIHRTKTHYVLIREGIRTSKVKE